MTTAFEIFGKDAFRKRYHDNFARLPINKAVFEALSVNLARLSEDQTTALVKRGAQVREGFIALCQDRSFESAISQGTGNLSKVNRRFNALEDMLSKVIDDA